MQVQFGLIVFVLLLGRTVRDALYLSRAGVEDLPWMYVGVSVLTTAATLVYTRVIGSFSMRAVAPALQFLFAASFTAFALLIKTSGSIVYAALYLWVEVLAALTIIQFWNMANSQFNPRQAKRLYGFIAAGQAGGNLLCGLIATGAGTLFPVDGLVWVIAIGSALAGLIYFGLNRQAGAAEKTAVREISRAGVGRQNDQSGSRYLPYVISIVALIAVTYVATSWVDFQFKVIARRSFDEAGLTRFFGQFYSAVGIASFFIQLFLLRHVTRWLGLFGSLLMMPVLFVVLGLLLPFFPFLAVATGLKFSENSLRYAVYDPLVQTLYLPLPSDIRAKFQSLASGIVKPAAMGLAGVALVPLAPDQVGGMPAEWLGPFAAGASAVVLVILFRLRSRYLNVLVNDTVTVADERKRERVRVDDSAAISRLLEVVEKGGAEAVGWVLERVEVSDAEAWQGILITALNRDDLPFLLRTRLLQTYVQAAPDLRTDAHAENIGSEFLQHLARLRSDGDQWQALGRYLDDDDIGVREAALMMLLESGRAQAVLEARHTLAIFADDEERNGRLLALRLAEFLEPDDMERTVRTALAEDDPEIVSTALQFLARSPREGFLGRLVEILDNRQFRIGAVDAIAACGVAGYDSLTAGRDDTGTGLSPWRRLGPTWNVYCRSADIDWSQVAPVVVESDPDPVFWVPALLAANRTGKRLAGDHQRILKTCCDAVILWAGVADTLSNAVEKDGSTSRLLYIAAQRRLSDAVQSMICVLFIQYPPPIEKWDRLLRDDLWRDSKLRANLAEIVDQAVTGVDKDKVIEILDRRFTNPELDPRALMQLPSPLPALAAMTYQQLDANLEEDMEELIRRVLFLSTVPLFRELSGENLENIAEILEDRTYGAGESLMELGEAGDSLYLITSGKVRVHIGSQELAVLDAGAVVGEVALLDDQPRTASVTAIEPVTALRLDRLDFDQLLSAYPQMGRGIMRVITERMRSLTEQIQAAGGG